MEPPPLSSPPNPNITTTTATITPNNVQMNYPDSIESTTRSNGVDTFHEHLPSIPGAKLRMMCSYGGHIMPRSHDKSLCYVGGETRLIVVDRRSPLSAFTSRIARTLLNDRPFTLKYQLPNEDLDTLVSVSTEEDLENMIEEYDHVSSSAVATHARIRLFLFFNKPETAASMGSLLDDVKNESWSINVLNGSGLLPRNLSDSATMDCLVNLDTDDHDLEAQANGIGAVEADKKIAKNVMHLDVNSTTPDNNVLENSTSSSCPSTSNLPPIQIRAEDTKPGIEEQFVQMTLEKVVQQKQEDGYSFLNIPPPPIPTTIAGIGTMTSISPAGSCEHLNLMSSDDDRSDKDVPVAFCKPPPPLQPLQVNQKLCTYYNLPSPDSVASDESMSPKSFSKQSHYQDHDQVAPGENRTPANHHTIGSSSQIQVQRVQDPNMALPPQLYQLQQQKHFMQASTYFIPHEYEALNGVPVSSYFPFYAIPPSHQIHQPIDHQQYQLYLMPISQTQPPYMSMQPNLVDATAVVSLSQKLKTPAHTTSITSASTSATYKHPPRYPPNAAAATSVQAETTSTAYRAALTSTPQVVQVSANQFQQQLTGCPQMQHAPWSVAVAPLATVSGANNGYEYADSGHDQAYHLQHQHQATSIAISSLPPQYQSMSPVTAVAVADASKQKPPANNMVQQTTTSQPKQL